MFIPNHTKSRPMKVKSETGYLYKSLICWGISILLSIGMAQPLLLQAQSCEALCEAIKASNVTAAAQLLENGATVNCQYAYQLENKYRNPNFRAKNSHQKRVQLPVHFIAQADFNYEKLIQLLKNHAVDFNSIDNMGQTVAHLAAAQKNETLIQLLLQENININALDRAGNTILTLIIDADTDLETIQKMLRKGILVAQGQGRNSALFQAFKYNRIDIAKLLLENGASISETNQQYRSCLNVAIENQNFDLIHLAFDYGVDVRKASLANVSNKAIIGLLISKGADIQAVDLNNIIAYQEDKKFIQWLLSKGADPNQKGFLGQTPIFNAIQKNDLEVVKILVQAGADLQYYYKDNENYLTLAVAQPQINTALVDYLIQKGVAASGIQQSLDDIIASADTQRVLQLLSTQLNWKSLKIRKVNDVDFANFLLRQGFQLKDFDLESIIAIGNIDMLAYLTENNINLNARNAIYMAVDHQQIGVLNYLLQKDYNPNLPFRDGRWLYTPLMRAVLNENIAAIKLLTAAGADVNAMNDQGQTILQMAILSENAATLNFLLQNSVDFQHLPLHHKTLLVKTCMSNGLAGILQQLLRQGLDISELSLADFVESNNDTTLTLLIEKGISVGTPNQKGETPLYVAFNNRYYKIFNLLLQEGANINDICLAAFMSQQIRLDHYAIKLLVSKGIDLNKTCNTTSLTPIQIAIKRNDLRMVKFLLESGNISASRRAKQAKKAYRYAKKYGASEEVLNFLKT